MYLITQEDEIQETNPGLRMPLGMGLLRLAPEISRINFLAILKKSLDRDSYLKLGQESQTWKSCSK